MKYLIIYLLIFFGLAIILSYYNVDNKLDLSGIVFISILWPISIPCVILLIIIFFPIVLGKWIRERKTNKITFIKFIKFLFDQ